MKQQTQECKMTDVPKIAEKHRFLMAIEKAVDDYHRQIADSSSERPPKWGGGDLDEVAKSAAIQFEISYDGDEVDPAIVKAIRLTANPKNSQEAQKTARDEAWTAYCAHKQKEG